MTGGGGFSKSRDCRSPFSFVACLLCYALWQLILKQIDFRFSVAVLFRIAATLMLSVGIAAGTGSLRVRSRGKSAGSSPDGAPDAWVGGCIAYTFAVGSIASVLVAVVLDSTSVPGCRRRRVGPLDPGFLIHGGRRYSGP